MSLITIYIPKKAEEKLIEILGSRELAKQRIKYLLCGEIEKIVGPEAMGDGRRTWREPYKPHSKKEL